MANNLQPGDIVRNLKSGKSAVVVNEAIDQSVIKVLRGRRVMHYWDIKDVELIKKGGQQ